MAGRKPMTWVTRYPIYKSKGQRSRSLGRLVQRRKMRHIFWRGRPTNFKLGVQMEYDDPQHQNARWPQRSKVKVMRSCQSCSDRRRTRVSAAIHPCCCRAFSSQTVVLYFWRCDRSGCPTDLDRLACFSGSRSPQLEHTTAARHLCLIVDCI